MTTACIAAINYKGASASFCLELGVLVGVRLTLSADFWT